MDASLTTPIVAALCPHCGSTYPAAVTRTYAGLARVPDGRVVLLCTPCEVQRLCDVGSRMKRKDTDHAAN